MRPGVKMDSKHEFIKKVVKKLAKNFIERSAGRSVHYVYSEEEDTIPKGKVVEITIRLIDEEDICK